MPLTHPRRCPYVFRGCDLVRVEGLKQSREFTNGDRSDNEYGIGERPESNPWINLRDLRVDGLDIAAACQADENFTKRTETGMRE